MKQYSMFLIYLSRFISSVGDQFYTLALSTTLFTLTGSALATTGYLAIKGIVYILGFLIYRAPKKQYLKLIIVIGDFTRGLLILILLIVLFHNFWIVYLILFLMEVIQLFYSPARVLLVHDVAENKQQSHKIDQISTTLSLTLGLSLGG